MLMGVACVPARKFEEISQRAKDCESTKEGLIEKNRVLDSENKAKEEKLQVLSKDVERLQSDTHVTGVSLRKMTSQYDKINQLNDELIDKVRQLQKSNENESYKLMGALDQANQSLSEKEEALRLMERSLNAKEQNLGDLNKTLQSREARVKELEDVIAQKEEAANSLKKKVSDALLGFKDKGLTVEQKNGKIYVSMDAKLLFAKGSTVVDQEGKKALQDLAVVLKDQKDISVLVEGHTDTDKIVGGTMKDNWDLSVLRATSVVRILTEKGLDPNRVSPAGRGEFAPIDPGNNELAKSKNRRIEVVIAPNLDKLFELIEK